MDSVITDTYAPVPMHHVSLGLGSLAWYVILSRAHQLLPQILAKVILSFQNLVDSFYRHILAYARERPILWDLLHRVSAAGQFLFLGVCWRVAITTAPASCLGRYPLRVSQVWCVPWSVFESGLLPHGCMTLSADFDSRNSRFAASFKDKSKASSERSAPPS